MVDVAHDVIELLAGKARNKHGPVQMSDLLENLGLESLDMLELTFAIEEKFNIEIPLNANELNFRTVGDLVGAVERLVGKKTASA
jgi:acyl carrier protein